MVSTSLAELSGSSVFDPIYLVVTSSKAVDGSNVAEPLASAVTASKDYSVLFTVASRTGMLGSVGSMLLSLELEFVWGRKVSRTTSLEAFNLSVPFGIPVRQSAFSLTSVGV